MATSEEQAKQRLCELCENLSTDDPSITSIDFLDYGKLDWEDTSQLAAALEHTTHVREITLHLRGISISTDGHTPLLHFLRTSTSLRKVYVEAKGETPEQDLGATNVLHAVSHNKNVVSLSVEGQVYRRPAILQKLLSDSKTLTELDFYWREGLGNSSEVVQALRRGLQRNTSLTNAKLELSQGPQVPAILFGLLSHRSLQKLELDFVATEASAEALRFFLLGNDNIEALWLTLSCSPGEASVAMATLLLGVASNRGLKTFVLSDSILIGNQTDACASAWTEMLADNTTLEEFTLESEQGYDGNCGQACASAIARGIWKNVALVKLNLGNTFEECAFHGRAWRGALLENNTLRELVLTSCNIGTCSDFASFTQGLACNKSLKVLELQENDIDSSQALALVDALQTNTCLDTLNLAWNAIEGPDGATTVRGLWSKKNLLHLNLSFNRFGGGDARATVFSEGLPKNETLQTLDISDCSMNSSDFCVVVNSFCGSNALQTLKVGNNSNISIDGRAAAALKELLLCSSLVGLVLRVPKFSREGMAEVATGIRGNTSLRELNFESCEGIDSEELVALGEALQVNSTLELLNLEDCGVDGDGLRGFFELLPRLKGLKKLCIDSHGLDESVVEAIVEGVRRNTSLESISNLTGFKLPAADSLKSIEFYLKMNRNGRKYLQEDNKAKDKTKNGDNINNVRADMPHIGAWPRVLAKMSSTSEQDQLFYFLRRKTDLFQGPAPSRKRKASNSTVVERAV